MREKQEMIVIKQLPIIEEQLQNIKKDVSERIEAALRLVCNEDTVKQIKEVRAELNREFNYWEEKRKIVKKTVLSPYEQFEKVYKDCITETYKKADKELKGKINTVEDELKGQKRKEVEDYFNEYLSSKEIDFVTYENANINITLSASKKNLKEQAKAFIDRICNDLDLINTQEHREEILYEYKQKLNVSEAIITVNNRYKAIEEMKAVNQVEEKVKYENVIEKLNPPTVEESDPILTLVFKVTAPKSKLRALKQFLNEGNYKYE